jgi:hypothetical protein
MRDGSRAAALSKQLKLMSYCYVIKCSCRRAKRQLVGSPVMRQGVCPRCASGNARPGALASGLMLARLLG